MSDRMEFFSPIVRISLTDGTEEEVRPTDAYTSKDSHDEEEADKEADQYERMLDRGFLE